MKCLALFKMKKTGLRAYVQRGMKTERKRTELGGITFLSYFFAAAEAETKTPEMNTETHIIKNRHEGNIDRVRKQK